MLNLNGFINIIKPPGMTSHDVVGVIRKMTGIKKVGHTGTLDPGAAGVLPVCIGRATRLSSYGLSGQKSYRAEVTFGTETDSGDAYGTVTETSDYVPTLAEVKAAVEALIGPQMQKPPMTSAIKVDGKKLYELARKGETIEVEERPITVYDARLIGYREGRAIVDFTCSAGTYIRELCRKLGHLANSRANMTFLIRTACGSFTIAEAIPLQELSAENIESRLLPLEYLFPHSKRVELDSAGVKAFYEGRVLPAPDLAVGELALIFHGGTMIALAEGVTGGLKIKTNLLS